MKNQPAQATAIYNGLSQADQKTVMDDGLKVVKQDVTIDDGATVTTSSTGLAPEGSVARVSNVLKRASDPRAHAAGCWWVKVEVAGKSLAGVVDYYYDTHWDWCGNGSTVTSASHYEWSAGTLLLWQYDGSAYLGGREGNIGDWYVGRTTQGTFHLNCPWGGSCQQSFATIDTHVHDDGGYWYSWNTTGL